MDCIRRWRISKKHKNERLHNELIEFRWIQYRCFPWEYIWAPGGWDLFRWKSLNGWAHAARGCPGGSQQQFRWIDYCDLASWCRAFHQWIWGLFPGWYARQISRYYRWAYLEAFFPPRVSECVRLYVAAKRYLCAVEPAYFDQLSSESVHTLSLQGGPMSIDEVAEFVSNPYHQDAVKVRKWDDYGKAVGVETKLFTDYAPMLQKIVNGHLN